jgi:hypothetical protein
MTTTAATIEEQLQELLAACIERTRRQIPIYGPYQIRCEWEAGERLVFYIHSDPVIRATGRGTTLDRAIGSLQLSIKEQLDRARIITLHQRLQAEVIARCEKHDADEEQGATMDQSHDGALT